MIRYGLFFSVSVRENMSGHIALQALRGMGEKSE